MSVSKRKSAPKKTAASRTVKKKSTRKKAPARKKTTAARKIAASATGKADLVLAAVMVINDARTLYGELGDSLSKKEISIDASSVEMIDTAMLQLLVSFVEKMKNKKIKYSWKNPSAEFIGRADTLNMSKDLGLVSVND